MDKSGYTVHQKPHFSRRRPYYEARNRYRGKLRSAPVSVYSRALDDGVGRVFFVSGLAGFDWLQSDDTNTWLRETRRLRHVSPPRLEIQRLKSQGRSIEMIGVRHRWLGSVAVDPLHLFE